MTQLANRHRRDKQFAVGTKVYLKLKPYRQHSIATMGSQKLNQKYYGPFEIIEKIGEVAYKLHLPPTAKIHTVIHISQLKECKGIQESISTLPSELLDDYDTLEPEFIVERGLVKKGSSAKVQLLVKWKNKQLEDASWLLYDDFVLKFLNFPL